MADLYATDAALTEEALADTLTHMRNDCAGSCAWEVAGGIAGLLAASPPGLGRRPVMPAVPFVPWSFTISPGPIMGNRFSDARRAALKPHPRKRLALPTGCSMPLDTLTTDVNGWLSFAPEDDPLHGWDCVGGDARALRASAFRLGQRVCVLAMLAQMRAQEVYSFEPDDAQSVIGHEGVVIEDAGTTALGLVLVAMNPEP